MSPVALALRSIGRRPLSSAFAALVLALVLALTATLASALATVADQPDAPPHVHHALVGPKGASLTLLRSAASLDVPPTDVIPRALVTNLRELFDIEHLASLHIVGRVGPFLVAGTEDAWLHRPRHLHPPRVIDGRWFRSDDEAVLGREAAAALGLSPGDTFFVRNSPTTEETRAAIRRDPSVRDRIRYAASPAPFHPNPDSALYMREFRVSGIVDHHGEPGDRLILIPVEPAWIHYHLRHSLGIARDAGPEGVTSLIFIRLSDEERLPALRELIDRRSVADIVLLDEAHAELTTLADRARASGSAMRLGALLLLALASLLLVHLRQESLRNRLGVLLALGYQRPHLLALLAIEALLLLAASLPAALALHHLLTRTFPVAGPALPAADLLALAALACLALLPALLLSALRLSLVSDRHALQGV